VLVAEVLSDSTEGYDRKEKFLAYTRISGLKYYLLIAQDQYRVEVYARQSHDFWSYKLYSKKEDMVSLDHLDMEFTLEKLYARLFFN
jgi:Uma2 family endonuclease